MLANHPMTEINPGTIMLKEGESLGIALLVSGCVEKIRTSDKRYCSQSAGSLIGVAAMLGNRPSRHTYRASSFVRVMRLPAGLYAEVARRNGSLDRMRRTAGLRAFLDRTDLFSGGLPAATLGRIIDAASERRFQPGDPITGQDLRVLSIILSGLVERAVSGTVLDVLKERDFFGEEGAIFGVPGLSHLRALEETVVLQIPGEFLRDVPILRWKLFESYQRRAARVIYGGDQTKVFIWRNTLSIQVDQLDGNHKGLIKIANAIVDRLDCDRDSLATPSRPWWSTHYHFTAEKLMMLYDYPGSAHHARKHGELIVQVAEYQERVLGGDVPDKASFLHFFESWLVRHILDEDRRFGVFLNAKGVY